MAKKETNSAIQVKKQENGQLWLVLSGRLDIASVAFLWKKAQGMVKAQRPESLVIEAQDVDYCDGAGVSLLLWFKRGQLEQGKRFRIDGLRKEFAQLMSMLEPKLKRKRIKPRSFSGMVEDVGTTAVDFCASLRSEISFIGELICSILYVIIRPDKLRVKDTFIVAETSGANAFGLISIIGLLFGLILAFQSAIPMKQFGAEIYVADLVALSLLRVLGPFIAAVIYTARSGSAFAAEIGTMKVNEELDALTTMGLNPTLFLVVPRVIAATIVVPMLALCVILFGLIGAGIVMLSLGYPVVTYWNELISAVDMVDFTSGFVKSFVFGFLVSAVGCFRGLCTGGGSKAVGESATSAVVSGIVLVVVTEGIFAILYYFLGI